ncbi:MAG: ABC transporter permease [Nitrospirae bacterium]|nr:ABC transporter permease [Nitrospirota bacterium]
MMILYLTKRILLIIPTLLGVTFLTFLLLKAAPGDPAVTLIGERASPEAIERIRESLGAKESLFKQYAGYLKLIAQGEMGRSYFTHREIAEDLLQKFPNTLRLALTAMLLAGVTALLLGAWMAFRQNTWIDRFLSLFSMAGISIPVFWLGLILMLIFALTFHLLPPSGMGDGRLIYLVLPAVTLALPSACALARFTRAGILEVLGQPFIRAARGRGVAEYRLLFIHTLKNAFIPILTLIGLDFASYLNGAVLTETIFGWDGVGRYALDGILKRDYPVVIGVVLLGTSLFVFINLLIDLLYPLLDPRVRFRGRNEL